MKIIQIMLDILSWIVIGTFVVLILLTISSNSNTLGGYRSYIVQSGSMEPTIMTGDVVIIHSQYRYIINDVITFKNDEGRIVTHRIIKNAENNGQQVILTKGDANRSEDNDTITQNKIFGKVVLVIPKLGYYAVFVKSLPGLIIFIIIPAISLVINELLVKKNV